MHLIDEVSSNRTDESTNLLKTQRKGQTQERKKVNPGTHCTWRGWGAQGNSRNVSLYVDAGGRFLPGVLGLSESPNW